MRKVSFLFVFLTVLLTASASVSVYANCSGGNTQCVMANSASYPTGSANCPMHKNAHAKMNFVPANKHTK